MTEALAGLVLADKSAGPTSHDVVARVRRTLGGIKVGHGGTLDPMATGVLPLVLGAATRLLRFLPADPKVYRARVRLGFETDTGDADGRALAAAVEVSVTTEQVQREIAALVGPQLQLPPMYSAKKISGRRLYQSARAGLEVERAAVPVRIDRIELHECQGAELEFTVVCSPGTYVRALVTDLGRRLGTGATLIALRRLGSGPFRVEQALAAEQLLDASALRNAIVTMDQLPVSLPIVVLDDGRIKAFRAGQALLQSADGESGWFQIRSGDGHLIGIGERAAKSQEEMLLHPRVVLPEDALAATSKPEKTSPTPSS